MTRQSGSGTSKQAQCLATLEGHSDNVVLRRDYAGRTVCRFGFKRQNRQALGLGSGILHRNVRGPSEYHDIRSPLSPDTDPDCLHRLHRQNGSALGPRIRRVPASDFDRGMIDSPISVAFSPDGSRLVVGTARAANLRLPPHRRSRRSACRTHSPLCERKSRIARRGNRGQNVPSSSTDRRQAMS